MKHNIHKDLQALATAINKCQPDPKNARTGHDVEGIAESFKKYGQRNLIVINKKTNFIESGNGRWKAAKLLGWSHVAAIFVEDDPKTATGFAIADNRLSDISVFDSHTLHELFEIVSPDDIPGVDNEFLRHIGFIETPEPVKKPEQPEPQKDSEYHEMKFKLHVSQLKIVNDALVLAKNMPPVESQNPDPNGNALTRICELALTSNK